MPSGRGFGGWRPGSRRRQVEEREERIAANRLRVVRWAELMELVLPGFGMLRIRDLGTSIQSPRALTWACAVRIAAPSASTSYAP